jgi:hypothetical protein
MNTQAGGTFGLVEPRFTHFEANELDFYILRIPKTLLILVSFTAFLQSKESLRASDHSINGWYMYFGDHKVSKYLGVHLEGQVRRLEVIQKWQQLLLRPGLNIHLNKQVMLTFGYAFVESYPQSGSLVQFRRPEHRFYEQLLITQKIGKSVLQHRVRLEQRQVGIVAVTEEGKAELSGWKYQDRLRYMLRLDFPLRARWYAGLYEEVFLNIGKTNSSRTLDQNRFYVAIGHAFEKPWKIEIGYLNQFIPEAIGVASHSNHTFQFGIYSKFPFRKQ